ncbi:zinc knuckle CX2CX4HX4C [Artemisia annua]|uniref:Zinc knuckle CX2CX4HX4C n=1 Tax=Artemisia annua TaxID=35608 RepID=A0A2U1LHF9_ARTAN|nr:zinc knuckle CX2CX4HX4C [Artemisia annua]
MSEQEPKPPIPNESISPPPVVNPPCSRSDKNLKSKRTTRTMNPKSTSTMKHHEMLSKSTDVNVKKVITRSSSKCSDFGLGIEDMECGDEAGDASIGKEGGCDGSGGMNNEVAEDVGEVKSDTDKGMGKEKGVFGNDTSGNVSAMFPELNSTNVSQGSVDKLPEMPVPFDNNPVLNPSFTKNIGNEGNLGNNASSSKQGLTTSNRGVGDTSGAKDVEMNESNKSGKPMLFSNVVQGAKYFGGNKLKLVPCAIRDVTTDICEKGNGRASYARVLVEVDAAKGLVDSVEIWYRKLNRSMTLKVEYAWQPPICSHCCVLGHNFEKCTSRVSSDKEKAVKSDNKVPNTTKVDDVLKGDDGWQYVDNRKTNRNYVEQKSNDTAT